MKKCKECKNNKIDVSYCSGCNEEFYLIPVDMISRANLKKLMSLMKLLKDESK